MGGSISIDARLTDLKSTNFLRDAWRLKHPRERQFTWFNFDLSLASRLDSFLISRYLCAQVISCEIRPCVYSDHDFVYIEFHLNTADCRDPGVWKFNNLLLLLWGGVAVLLSCVLRLMLVMFLFGKEM